MQRFDGVSKGLISRNWVTALALPFIALLLLAGAAAADPVRSTHCPWGCPDRTPAVDQIVARDIYVLANDPKTKFPDWVAYTVSPRSIGTGEDRGWQTDSELGDKTLRKTDWEKANPVRGYEMGHIAPLADFTGLPKAKWSQANILSNITPQCGTLNNGRWKWLEEAERSLARSSQAPVYIVAGTLYIGDMPKLPNARRDHVVPSAFWKVIALKNRGKLEVAAFEMDQYVLANRGKCKRGTISLGTDYCQHLVPLTDVEKHSRLDLLPLASSIIDARTQATALLGELDCEMTADGPRRKRDP